MPILKNILLTLGMSLSLNVLAADPYSTIEQRDKSLNPRHSGDTMQYRDCLIRNGNDKVFCEKEMFNDRPNPANINEITLKQPNPNGEIRDDVKTKNSNPSEVQLPSRKLKDTPAAAPIPDKSNSKIKFPDTNNPGDTNPM